MQRLGRAGGGRDHGNRRSTSAAQVFMREVEDHLIVGVGVDGGHRPALNLEVVVNYLRHWSKTVGRAGCIGDHVMLCGIVLVFIHSQNNCDVLIFCRSGDDDLLHRTMQMLLCVRSVGEFAGGLDDHLSPD